MKVVLNDISNITGNPTSAEQLLNDNFAKIEVAIENTLSRDGTTPNALGASLDANSHRIINLPFALEGSEPVPLAQVMKLVTGEDWTGGVGVPAIVFYQDEEPTATAAGQVWVRLSTGEIFIWNGESWVYNQDPSIAAALAQADSAISAANAASDTAINALDSAGAAEALAATAEATANQAAVDILALEPRVLAVEQDAANFSTAIIELESDVATIAGQITVISADVGDNTAAIQTEAIARANADTALAATINTLQASNAQIFIQAAEPVPGVGGIPNPIPEGSFWYDSDDGNSQYRYHNSAWVNVDNAEIVSLQSQITTEQAARIAEDSALATDITQLQTWRSGDYALIISNNQARIDGDAALTTSLSALQVDYNNLSATVATNNTARITADNALSSSISTLDARITSNTNSVSSLSATVNTYNQARIDGDSALASQLSTLNSTVGGLNTTVSLHTASINGIEGKYGVKIDSNGYITGFGLISSNNTASPTSIFTVLADNFQIVTPGQTPVKPFYVSGGITYIRNVVIDEAAIGSATIGTINIKQSAVSDVVTQAYDFLGATGPNLSVGVWANLTTVNGTAAITVPTIIIPGSKVLIRTYFNAKRAGTSGENVPVRIRRNDGVILPSVPTIRLGQDILVYAWEFVDSNPVSASHTYTAQISRSGSGSGNTGDWYDIQLIATVLKR